jgi:hypothetical protein
MDLYLQDNDTFNNVRKALRTQSQSGLKYKFGVEVPRSVQHAIQLDLQNENNLWKEALQIKLAQINEYKTFCQLAPGQRLPTEYKVIPYHIIFDVKFDGRRKSCLVADGNHADPPKEDVYSGVVGTETVRLAFLVASLNNLKVCAADIGNAFLYGCCKEKLAIRAGIEFGPLQGQLLIIYKSLYGTKTGSAAFHEHLAEKLRQMGFKPSYADTDFWIQANGDHYEYVGCYVDNVLAISRNPMAIITVLKDDYVLKGMVSLNTALGGMWMSLATNGVNTALNGPSLHVPM